MKFLILICLLIFPAFISGQGFIYPSRSDFPAVRERGDSIAAFIPKNWSKLGEAFGDLNGDGRDDAALALKGGFAKYIQENKGLGSDPFDTNPRILLILFREGKGYRLAERSDSFIISAEFPNRTEPFLGMKIRRGVLSLEFEYFLSAGSWYSSNTQYKFQFRDGGFKLIGADKTERMRNSGETTGYSYDFIKKRAKTTKSEGRLKVAWRNLNTGSLKTFKTFKAPETWKLGKNENL